MKTNFTCIAIAMVCLLLSCQKDPEETIQNVQNGRHPIIVDSSYVPAIKELRYAHHGTYVFGFGDSGYYRFFADTIGNEFKITMTNYYYVGSTLADSIRYIYRYDTLYNLTSIERNQFVAGNASFLELYYNNTELNKIEETSDNIVYETYHISRSIINGNRKVAIDPYLVSTSGPGGLTDTITHELYYNSQGKLIQTFERFGRKGSNFNEAFSFNYAYTYDGNDVIVQQGYEKHDSMPPSLPYQDSIHTTIAYIRHSAENPVLYKMQEKLYGKEFYHFISTFSLYFQSGPGGSFELLLFPGIQERSFDERQYAGMAYVNGVQTDFHSAHFTTQIQLDAQQRLFKYKEGGDIGPNYYTWEVVYR